MGADQSNASGGASSRGWSGSSSSSDAGTGTSTSPPTIMRRISQGAGTAFPSKLGNTFPSLKLGETLASQNPASTQPSSSESWDSEPPSPTSMSGDLGSSDFAKLRAAKLGTSNQKASLPTSDIPQPTTTIDEFAPGDQRSRQPHQPHITHLTHPWHKPTFEGSSVQGQGSALSRSPPLTQNIASFSKQVLGMGGKGDEAAVKDSFTRSTSSPSAPFMSSTVASSSPLPTASTRLQQRRMSTGSMMPPKEGPFDASPDDLHREWRLATASHSHSYTGPSRTTASTDITGAPIRRPRAASLSAEGSPDARAAAATRSPSPSSESVFAAADKFAGGFPW